MFAHGRHRRFQWFVAAMCLSLLILRVGGMHLHFCFDGSEPPVSLHLPDSGVHHVDEHAAGETHSDRDVPVANDALVKKSNTFDVTLALFAFALLLFLVAPVSRLRPISRESALVPDDPSRLRPPLRGPPLPA